MKDLIITDPMVTDYIHEHYRPYNQILEELRSVGEKDRVPIILKETELILGTILALKKPKKILEIGTAIGYSAIYFASRCEGATVHTIEKDEYAYKAAVSNIKTAGFDGRITNLFGDGQEQIEKLRDKGINGFDFVFIDAAKSHYRRFFDAALSVCKGGAVLVCDNVLQRGTTTSEEFAKERKHRTNIVNMRSFVDYITTDSSLDTSLLSAGDGMAISIYRGENG